MYIFIIKFSPVTKRLIQVKYQFSQAFDLVDERPFSQGVYPNGGGGKSIFQNTTLRNFVVMFSVPGPIILKLCYISM